MVKEEMCGCEASDAMETVLPWLHTEQESHADHFTNSKLKVGDGAVFVIPRPQYLVQSKNQMFIWDKFFFIFDWYKFVQILLLSISTQCNEKI